MSVNETMTSLSEGTRAGQRILRGWRVRWILVYSVVMFCLLGAVTVSGHGGGGTVPVDVRFVSTSTNDPPHSVDPGYTKNVATCLSWVHRHDLVKVFLLNGYPSYTCQFTVTIQNTGRLKVKLDPLQIEAPPVLTVTDASQHAGIELAPGQKDIETFWVHVEQESQQEAWYSFVIKKPFKLHHKGSVEFWKKWKSHNTFSKSEIESWLIQIDRASKWWGPRTTTAMESTFHAGVAAGAAPNKRFLAHCLATRLNERAGILAGSSVHDVHGSDPGNYLGLTNPSAATLSQILARMEAKFGTAPSNTQLNVMKNVCERLNNLDM
jgi:hypothetical protein